MVVEAEHLLGMNREDLTGWLEAGSHPPFRANQIFQWVFGRRVFRYEEMSDLPSGLRDELAKNFPLSLPECVRIEGSKDSTRKFLFRLADQQMVETVLIPASPALYGEASDRRTLCVSSQVGCAYGCKFCASGLDGWKRNLTPAEIVAQLLAVETLSGEKVGNIVFMGMGEPFANFQNLMKAIGILNSNWGAGIGARKITVSTSGLVPRIRDYADQPLQTRLAISLHGATNETRSLIMPVNARHPVESLMEACAYYTSKKKQFPTFEFILIEGINDSPAEARALAIHAVRLGAKVNLIPYNTVDGLDWKRPAAAVQENFLKILRSAGVKATLRREKGHDIAAACGQLRLRHARDGEKIPFAEGASRA